MAERVDRAGETVDDVRRFFAEFARDYPDLPLYAHLTSAMSADADLARMLLVARPGQARPVLFLAALHDLVLRRPDVPAAPWFARAAAGELADGDDPWPDVRATVVAHRAELERTIATRTTQTNEVNRAVYVATLLHLACRDVGDLPVGLVELGASAGLLLGVDRYRVGLGDLVTGPADSAVRCHGEDRSRDPLRSLLIPPIAPRVGVDLHPVSLDDDEAVRWLQACLWPDVPGRLERFRAAVDVLRDGPPQLVEGDIVDALPTAAEAALSAGPARHLVVLTSWALTYVHRTRRDQLAEHLAQVAADGTPVSWVSAEPPGAVPGVPQRDSGHAEVNTVLAARRWRDGVEVAPEVYGHCHPHGAWVELDPLPGGGDRAV